MRSAGMPNYRGHTRGGFAGRCRAGSRERSFQVPGKTRRRIGVALRPAVSADLGLATTVRPGRTSFNVTSINLNLNTITISTMRSWHSLGLVRVCTRFGTTSFICLQTLQHFEQHFFQRQSKTVAMHNAINSPSSYRLSPSTATLPSTSPDAPEMPLSTMSAPP